MTATEHFIDTVHAGPVRLIVESRTEESTSDVIRMIDELSPLIPRWLDVLCVKGGSLGDDVVADVFVEREYRHATITLDDSFFTAGSAESLRYLTHELMHINMAEIQDIAMELARRFDQDHDGMSSRAVRQAVESAVCDLSSMALRIGDFRVVGQS